MNVLFVGDVVGKSGRTVVLDKLPGLRRELAADFVIVNGENAAHGFGITEKICNAFFEAGADVITTGNHVWDQRETVEHISREPRLLRPLNFPGNVPGHGYGVFEAAGRKVLVIQVMGRLFMEPLDDPFGAVEQVVAANPLGVAVDCVVVDFHAEATSEKMALAHAFDGRVSAVVGSHTHVPTADSQVLPAGTAYLTDIGMCGDYDSVIGMAKGTAVERFIRKAPTERLEPASGEATFCAAWLEIYSGSGLARRIECVRAGGRLSSAWPVGMREIEPRAMGSRR